MMTNQELQALFTDCLTSNSHYPLQVHLNALVDRGNHGAGTERYRIKFMGTEVTSMNELVSAITTDTFLVTPALSTPSDELKVAAYFDNIVVTFDHTYPSDDVYARFVSNGNFKLGFEISYVPGHSDFFELRVIRHIFKSAV